MANLPDHLGISEIYHDNLKDIFKLLIRSFTILQLHLMI